MVGLARFVTGFCVFVVGFVVGFILLFVLGSYLVLLLFGFSLLFLYFVERRLLFVLGILLGFIASFIFIILIIAPLAIAPGL